MKSLLKKILKTPKANFYIYGVIRRPDGAYRENVRKNILTGRVEFILWQAGQQGHKEDFWHEMGAGWDEYFIPNKE